MRSAGGNTKADQSTLGAPSYDEVSKTPIKLTDHLQ